MSSYAKISNKKVRRSVFNKYNGKCAYCGCKLKDRFTIDHIIPKRRYPTKLEKGKDELLNYNPCCVSCNSSKSTFSLEKWRNEIQLKYQRLLRDSSSFRLLSRFGIVKRNLNRVQFYFEKF